MSKLCYYDMQENKEDDGEGDLDLVRVVSRIEHDHTLSKQGQVHVHDEAFKDLLFMFNKEL